jgi:hypothetical protein
LSRFRTLALFATLAALASVLAACGGGGSDDPQSVVDEATLQGIESAELDLALGIDIEGKQGGRVDVNLSGPFQGESEEELPELDLTATAKGAVGDKKIDFDGGLVLLGNKAFVAYEGTDYEVDSTTFSFVRSTLRQQSGGQGSSEATACQDAVANLEPADFVEGLKDGGSAEVGGTSTTKVSGDLDAPRAIEALIELLEDPVCSEQLEATGQLPSKAELEEAKSTVEDSVKSAHVDLYVGDDDIVRRIVAQATVEPRADGDDGKVKRVDIDLDLTLTGVNEEQTISPPRTAKPLSDLFLKLGVNPIELLSMLQNSGGGGGLGGLLEGLDSASGDSSSGGSGGSGGGRQAYLECLQEASTPVDIQNCTGQLQ